MEQVKKPLISVIVPIYKVEPYLRRCLDSLLAQTYTNLEIIAVDDGSPDSCGAIADEYAEKDARIRVIHRKNGGLSAARNSGLEIAAGDYIGFVDSDDHVEPEMYETLLQLIETYGADIAECATVLDTDTGLEDESGILELCGSEAILAASVTDRISTPVWCKLYRADYWKTLRFPEGLLYEDALTLPDILENEPKFVRTEKKLYSYNRESTSILRSRKSMKHLRSKEAVFDLYEAYFKSHPTLSELHAFYMCSNIPSRNALIRRTDNIPQDVRRTHRKKMRKLFLTYWDRAKETAFFKSSPRSKQLLWTMYRYCPALAQWLAAHYTKKRTR